MEKQDTVSLEELLVSCLATADALAKLLIKKGIIAEVEFMSELSAERVTYQRLFQKKGADA